MTNASLSTSSSLLERVKSHDADAWQKLSDLYGPLVYRWARQSGMQASDASDVVQEVFRSVAANIDDFRRDRPTDSFRGWLWTISRNKIRDHFRRAAARPGAVGGSAAHQEQQQIPQPHSDDDGDDRPSDDGGLIRRALEFVRAEFEERTWQAFWRVTVDGQSPGDVARQLGMRVSAVYMAKSRVLRRVREELSGLID